MIPRLSPVGLLLALLAIVMQSVAGMACEPARIVSRVAAGSAAELVVLSALLPGAGILCHADDDAPMPGQQPHGQRDCTICPLCVLLTQSAALPSRLAGLPVPHVFALPLAPPPPQAAAPPAADRTSARPRAPPALTGTIPA